MPHDNSFTSLGIKVAYSKFCLLAKKKERNIFLFFLNSKKNLNIFLRTKMVNLGSIIREELIRIRQQIFE